MKKGISLDGKEFTSVLTNVIGIKLFFTFPKRLILNSGNAAWMQIAYVSLIFLIIYAITNFCYKRCGNLSIIDLSERIGGKVLKIITGILVLSALFLNLASTMRSFPEMVKMVLLPNTPIEIILIILAIVAGLAAYGGLEAIGRIHAIFIPIVVEILAVFFILLIPHISLYNIFPIFGQGTYNIFVKGLSGIDFYDDILILNLLLPYAKNTAQAKKSGYKAILISSGAGFLLMLIYGLVYPYPSSEKFIVPIYQLTRLVGIGEFFQRFEAFFEFIWSISIFLYTSLYVLVMCNVLRDIFDLKYEKPLIFPVIAITTILSFGAQGVHQIVYEGEILSYFVLFVAFLLPVLMPLVYKIKRKRQKGCRI